MSQVRKLRREIKRQQKGRERWERAQQAAGRPIGGVGRLVNWLFAFLPLALRKRIVWLKYKIQRAFLSPIVPPSRLGEAEKGEYRPVQIELGFLLFPDGSVQYINRWGGNLQIEVPAVIDMVHHEYNCLVNEAKRLHALN